LLGAPSLPDDAYADGSHLIAVGSVRPARRLLQDDSFRRFVTPPPAEM